MNFTTKEDLKKIEKLDYLFLVSNNMDDSPKCKVFFGEMGTGKSPNYLIKRSDSTEVAYNGRSHELYSGRETFDRGNISTKGFTLDEVIDAFDHQKKSKEKAIILMSNFWKLNKENYKNSPVNQRESILALSISGTPIAKAFQLILQE